MARCGNGRAGREVFGERERSQGERQKRGERGEGGNEEMILGFGNLKFIVF